MTIDKLNSINPINRYSQVQKKSEIMPPKQGDTISLSSAGLESAALQQAISIVRETPDVRQDRVDQVKANLEDPNYFSEELFSQLADKLLGNI